MVQSAIAFADRELVVPAVPPSGAGADGDVLELFGLVTDGRSGQGRDHPVAVLAWGRQFVSKNLGWRLNLC